MVENARLTAEHRGDSLAHQQFPARSNGYRLDIVIGMGNFGIVWRAECLEGHHAGQIVAIKILDTAQFEDATIQEFRKESAIMNTSRHQNIVSEHISFMSGNHLWIVMQLVDAGSCCDIMQMMKAQSGVKGIRDEAIIATIIRETMNGLKYLHTNGKIHRDIKAGNILMDLQGEVLLTDFGVSANMKKGQKNNTVCGSPCWMAPEVMQSLGHDTAADIWSLGITAIELAMGDAPLSQYTHMKVIRLILDQSPPTLPNSGWTAEFKTFVNACLQKDPTERPSIETLFQQHAAFLSKARDQAYLRSSFLSTLPPLEQRLRPELAAHGQQFLNELQQTRRPKKSRMNFDFSSGDKQTAQQQQQQPQPATHVISNPQVLHPAAQEDDGLFDDLGSDEDL